MPAELAPLSSVIAYGDGQYFDPITGYEYDHETAMLLINQELAAGRRVEGIGNVIVSAEGDVSDQQNKDNLARASAIVMQQLGLVNIPRQNWSIDSRVGYVTLFADFIIQNQAGFNPATVQIAQNMVGHTEDLRNVSSTAEATVAITNFVATAAQPLSGLGDAAQAATRAVSDTLNGLSQSVSNLAAIAPWVIPAAVTLAIFVLAKNPAQSVKAFR